MPFLRGWFGYQAIARSLPKSSVSAKFGKFLTEIASDYQLETCEIFFSSNDLYEVALF
jgi:hypothetical protein